MGIPSPTPSEHTYFHLPSFSLVILVFTMPWGKVVKCPACDKTVYPMEQVFAADRKVFHKSCIKCQVQGCSNELTERGLHKHDGYNFCDSCHETYYDPRSYGVPEGGESIEERRLREKKEKEERERKEREMERLRKGELDGDESGWKMSFLKIADIVEIAPSESYCI